MAGNQTSLRALARRVGHTHPAISKAVRERRLTAGVAIEAGRVVVTDVDAAVAQWNELHKVRVDEMVRREQAAAPATPAPTPLQEVRARREAVQLEIAELELEESKGKLIDAEDARREMMATFAIVRTRLLGVPTRVAQRLPKLAAEVVTVIDELLREALTDLADEDGDVEQA